VRALLLERVEPATAADDRNPAIGPSRAVSFQRGQRADRGDGAGVYGRRGGDPGTGELHYEMPDVVTPSASARKPATVHLSFGRCEKGS
jgi:hypothetical protein